MWVGGQTKYSGSLSQSHYLSGWVGGWVVGKTKITEVVAKVEDDFGNTFSEGIAILLLNLNKCSRPSFYLE